MFLKVWLLSETVWLVVGQFNSGLLNCIHKLPLTQLGSLTNAADNNISASVWMIYVAEASDSMDTWLLLFPTFFYFDFFLGMVFDLFDLFNWGCNKRRSRVCGIVTTYLCSSALLCFMSHITSFILSSFLQPLVSLGLSQPKKKKKNKITLILSSMII